jgi:branched-chain amino acid transport system permease protein
MVEPERRVAQLGWGLGSALVAGLYGLPVATRALMADDTYLLQVAIWIGFFAYLSASWNLIGGFGGQVSIGHAGFLGLGAYVSTLFLMQANLSPWIGMVLGGLAATAIGLVIGYPCFRLRGVFFSLVSIAFAEMLRVSTELTDSLFGIPIHGVSGLVLPVMGHRPLMFQFVDKRYYYWIILTLLLLVLAVAGAVKRAKLGYYLAAIGEDEDAAESLGVHAARCKLAALALSAFFTAVGGTFYAQFILYIAPPRIMSLDFSIQMVIMAILGGMGTVLGPVYGALILVPISEITRAAWGGGAQGLHLILHGALLMLAILYFPRGIEGWVRRAAARGVRGLAALVWPAAAPRPAAEPVAGRIRIPEGRLLGSRAPAGAGDGTGPLLAVRGLWKSFGGAAAVCDLDLEVRAGEVVGLIGPNGAGKTTVFNLVTGMLPPDRGEVRFGGADLRRAAPHAVNRRGVARTFQILRPFTNLTALENVMVAAMPRTPSVEAARAEAARCLGFVGLAHRADVPGGGLSTGERKRLELARALATGPRLLLLDEVTGGVDQRSLPDLIALIRRVRAEGVTLVIIEHNLRVITALSDRLVVLHLGEKVADGPTEAIVRDPRVVDIYVGASRA